MSSNRAGDLIGRPERNGWLGSARKMTLVRLPVFFGVLLSGYIAAQLGRAWINRHVPAGGADWMSIAATLALAAVLVGVYAGLVRWLEVRPVSELAPDPIRCLAGIILGLALFSSVFGLLRLIGVAQWQGIAGQFDVAPVLAVSILAAIGEELAFRGALFRILEEGFGTGTALAVSAALFGLLHALNPGATAVSTTAIALEAGVLLAAAYAVTRNLWFPIGLHLGWNFTEGGIFGVSVSGGHAGEGILSVSLAGPRLLTGGAFGPEASLVAITVCLAVAIVLIVITARNGGWIPMRGRPVRSPA